MKKKRQNRKQPLGGAWKPLAVLALAAGVVLAAPGMDGAARAVDFDRACTLEVAPGNGEVLEDLSQAQVVVDLYKVADAEEVPGQDTYSYKALPPYEALDLADITDNARWKELSQEAAAVALSGQTPTAEGLGTDGEKSGSLEAGLYLVVARGADEPDYIAEITTEEAEGEGQGEGETLIATIAHSDNYVYTFLPELVSLPGKPPVEGEDGPVYGTANPGAWIYDMEVVLKPSQSVRYGSLEIEKVLRTYETSGPATFVFSVEAVLRGRTVYSDVVSLSFTEPGRRSVVLDRIPVGAQVTVEEVYSGASYSLETERVVSTVIEAQETSVAAFTNDYDGRGAKGGAVTNHFEYETEAGWTWTQTPDGPAE